jgi:hypothetical protein
MPIRRDLMTSVLLALAACGPQQAGDEAGATITDAAITTGGETPTTETTPTGGGDEQGSSGEPQACPSGQVGELLAETVLDQPAEMVWAQSIAVDPEGVTYLVGALWSAKNSSFPALVRIGPDGAVLGMHVHDDIGPQGFVTGVGRKSDGVLMIGGQRGDDDSAFVADFAADGAPIGLSPLPGAGDRHIDAMAIGPDDGLFVAGQDTANTFWTTAISPGGSLLWDIPSGTIGGPTRLAVGSGNQVAAAHGQWNGDQMQFAGLDFTDNAAGLSWMITEPGEGDVGSFSAVVVRASGDVVVATSQLLPPGKLELRVLARASSAELSRTTLLEEEGTRLLTHDLWLTPEGHTQALVTRHAPATDPVEVSARVITIDADGEVIGSAALDLGLDATLDRVLLMRAAQDGCGALRIWDSPTRTLRSVQL